MRTKVSYVVLMVVLQGLCAQAVIHPIPPVNVILIGWDRAQRGHVMEALGLKGLSNMTTHESCPTCNEPLHPIQSPRAHPQLTSTPVPVSINSGEACRYRAARLLPSMSR